MNIAIFMSVGCQNLGDELILKNEILLLKKKYGNNSQFKIFTYDIHNIFYHDEKVEYQEYFPIGIKNPKNIMRNMKNYYSFVQTVRWANKIIIGGGGIFFDNESGNYSNPLKQWLFRTHFAQILKKEIIFFGVSIDIKNEKNKKIVKKIFLSAKEIFVRDEHSHNYLKQLGISSHIILDPVYSDNGEIGKKNYQKNFLQKKIKATDFSVSDIENFDFMGKTVGFALRSGYIGTGGNGDEKKIIQDLIQYIISQGGSIILLPHSFHQIDPHANDYEFLKDFLTEHVSITTSMSETYEVYSGNKIDFCLSMRLHSMVLCQVYGIEFIGIVYSKKGEGI